jgi:hypothetical protein
VGPDKLGAPSQAPGAALSPRGNAVIEVFASNDPVRISYAQALLSDAGIEHVTLDGQTAGLFGGALPWIKRRLMVHEDDERAARRILEAAFNDDGEA